jgi:acetolactate synthase-1/2/3 large subunit
MGRGRIANGVIRDADVVLLVGTKTGNVATSNWTLPDPSCRTVHVDVDVAEIGRNYRSLGVLGDAKLGLAALAAGLEAAGARPATGRRADLARDLSDWRARIRPSPNRVLGRSGRSASSPRWRASSDDDTDRLRRRQLQLAVGRRPAGPAPPGPAPDLGTRLRRHRVGPARGHRGQAGRARQAGPVPHRRRRVRLRVPGARDRRSLRIGVVVVVLNNSTFAYQKHAEQLHYGRSFETELLDVDYAALARVLRCDGISVSDPDQLAPALGAAIASGRPTVINVVIDPEAFPPITAFDQLRAGAPVPVAH